LNGGLLSVWYQPATLAAVASPPIAATAAQTAKNNSNTLQLRGALMLPCPLVGFELFTYVCPN
jgi:hypothetical protein